MHVIKAAFDGERIVLPDDVRGLPPGEVIVVFDNGATNREEGEAWTRIQEAAFRQAWTNDDDAIYDTL
jgi:hypothetical protein